MFFITAPSTFNIGDTHKCNINDKPAVIKWVDADTLLIEPDDPKKILVIVKDDGLIHFHCDDGEDDDS
jgi:hypothetical protein